MLYLSSHQILTFQNFITEIDKSVNPVWFLVVFSWAVKVVVTAHLNSPTDKCRTGEEGRKARMWHVCASENRASILIPTKGVRLSP